MRFKDKVVIVTGSTRGIGKTTALLFAKEGAKVVLNGIDSDGHDLISEVKKLGSNAIFVNADVSNEEDVKRLINTTVEKFGKVDILVNNAGIVFDVAFNDRTVE